MQKQLVSTHNHPKVAASLSSLLTASYASFNTQPPEGGCVLSFRTKIFVVTVSTHSHPKVAAQLEPLSIHLIFKFQHTATRRWLQTSPEVNLSDLVFQHTATRRWLPPFLIFCISSSKFQHTATRRWLHELAFSMIKLITVSTHSHPKVAAYYTYRRYSFSKVSTHSHPKVAASFLC